MFNKGPALLSLCHEDLREKSSHSAWSSGVAERRVSSGQAECACVHGLTQSPACLRPLGSSLCFLCLTCTRVQVYIHTHTVYREIKRCQQNSVLRKFLDKLTTQLHYMTCHKMDEENLAGIMFCFQIAIYLRVLMDALLKHLGPGQVSAYVTVACD